MDFVTFDCFYKYAAGSHDNVLQIEYRNLYWITYSDIEYKKVQISKIRFFQLIKCIIVKSRKSLFISRFAVTLYSYSDKDIKLVKNKSKEQHF